MLNICKIFDPIILSLKHNVCKSKFTSAIAILFYLFYRSLIFDLLMEKQKSGTIYSEQTHTHTQNTCKKITFLIPKKRRAPFIYYGGERIN